MAFRTYPMPMWLTIAVGKAMREGHRITLCKACKVGPLVHSQLTTMARCFRCGVGEEQLTVSKGPGRLKCKTCKKLFHSRAGHLYCEKHRSASRRVDKFAKST